MKDIIKRLSEKRLLHIIVSVILLSISLFLILLNRSGVILPNKIQLGILSINFYGLFVITGLIVTASFIELRLRKTFPNIKNKDIWSDVLIIFVVGLVGARLFHVLSDWSRLYASNPLHVFFIWDGGLAFHGGLLFGTLTLYSFARRNKINFLQLLNTIVFYLPIAQIIGRYGNFFNQELFGVPTSNPVGIFISASNRPSAFLNESFFHPVFFYEQVGNFILLIIFWYFYEGSLLKAKDSKLFHVLEDGLIYVYLLGYGCIRLFTEYYRIEPQWLLGLSFGQVLSWVLIFVGISGLIILSISKYKRNEN